MALTPKQEKFCLSYLNTGSASEAYRSAYNVGSMKPATINRKAKEVLDNGKITARLKELTEKATTIAVMTKQEALERLTLSARVTVGDIAEFTEVVAGQDDKGRDVKETIWRIKDSSELSPLALSAIKSVTATKSGPKLEMHDPQSAIKQLSEMLGWNAPIESNVTASVKNEWHIHPTSSVKSDGE